MSNFLSRLASPAALLYLHAVFTGFATGMYGGSQTAPLPAFDLYHALGFLWVGGWWLQRDVRARGLRWTLDIGLFLYLAWPVVMLYYLLKTRGARGLLVILGFIAVHAGAAVAGLILYVMVSHEPG